MVINFSKMLENSHRKISSEAIIEFRKLVKKSICTWEGKINKEWENLAPDQFEDPRDIDEYKGVLDDQYYLASQVKILSDELSITALFKLVEIHTKRIVGWHMPSIESSKLFNFNALKSALPFDISLVKSYQAYDELLELNNAIKHVGKVSERLAQKHSDKGWKKGDNFTDLDKAFDRLLPLVSVYMDDLARNIYANSERNDT